MSNKLALKKPQEVVQMINSLRAEGMADGSIKELLCEIPREFELDQTLFEKAVDLLLKSELLIGNEDNEEKRIIVESEREFLRQIDDKEVKRLLTVLLFQAKENWHHTGWIRYDEKKVMEACGVKNHSKFLEITQRAVQKGLSFRVVGSKNPILCFKLSFLEVENSGN